MIEEIITAILLLFVLISFYKAADEDNIVYYLLSLFLSIITLPTSVFFYTSSDLGESVGTIIYAFSWVMIFINILFIAYYYLRPKPNPKYSLWGQVLRDRQLDEEREWKHQNHER